MPSASAPAVPSYAPAIFQRDAEVAGGGPAAGSPARPGRHQGRQRSAPALLVEGRAAVARSRHRCRPAGPSARSTARSVSGVTSCVAAERIAPARREPGLLGERQKLRVAHGCASASRRPRCRRAARRPAQRRRHLRPRCRTASRPVSGPIGTGAVAEIDGQGRARRRRPSRQRADNRLRRRSPRAPSLRSPAMPGVMQRWRSASSSPMQPQDRGMPGCSASAGSGIEATKVSGALGSGMLSRGRGRRRRRNRANSLRRPSRTSWARSALWSVKNRNGVPRAPFLAHEQHRDVRASSSSARRGAQRLRDRRARQPLAERAVADLVVVLQEASRTRSAAGRALGSPRGLPRMRRSPW